MAFRVSAREKNPAGGTNELRPASQECSFLWKAAPSHELCGKSTVPVTQRSRTELSDERHHRRGEEPIPAVFLFSPSTYFSIAFAVVVNVIAVSA